MRSSGGGKASFTFHEIGNSKPNGTITATGAAFFDTNATGNLAFLGNVVAVYKDQIYKNGTESHSLGVEMITDTVLNNKIIQMQDSLL